MFNAVKKFLRDEGGNVTIESLVVIGGSVWMASVVITDISIATMGVTERLERRLEYTSIVSDILSDYGPATVTGGDTGDTGGSDSDDDCAGNPGNEKCVGNAGENPNGGDDWGSGSNGMSDAGDSSTSSASGSSSPGNSGSAPGRTN